MLYDFSVEATRLLNQTQLYVGGRPHRLAEIEFYLHDQKHPDPFAHCHSLQSLSDRWYFHRQGNSYKSGTFKGLDLTFGSNQGEQVRFGGVLIRSLVTPDDVVIDGPSLCVDHLLKQTGCLKPADLDQLIAERSVRDESSPLSLRFCPHRGLPIYPMARVGLTLKKANANPTAAKFMLQPYRFLNEPKRITKGRLYSILSLYAYNQLDVDQIRKLTGSPLATIQQAISDFETGRQDSLDGLDRYYGIDFDSSSLAKWHGMWHALGFGSFSAFGDQ